MRYLRLLALPMMLVIISAAQFSCGRSGLQKVIISEGSQPAGASLYAAVENGFFERYGLDVEVVNFEYGSMAVDALLAGKADFAVAAETPFLRAIVNQHQPRLLATIGKATRYYAVAALEDQGIRSPQDLRGRRIGVTQGSSGEYFFNLILNLHGLKNDEVTMVPLMPRDMPEALVSKKVDALATWDFVIDRIPSGTPVSRIEIAGILDFVWNLMSTQSYLSSHPDTAEKILRGLKDGEVWCRKNNHACIETVIRRTGLSEESVRKHWDKQQLQLEISQSLLINCENQLRWMSQNEGDELEYVNVLNYFDLSSLRKVEPDSISLIE